MNRTILETIETPTDIVIYGNSSDNGSCDFSLTSDESSYNMIIDGKMIDDYCSSLGTVNILTVPNFIKEVDNLDSEEDDMDWIFDGPVESFLIRGFQGEIALKVTVEEVFVDIDNLDVTGYIFDDKSLLENYTGKNRYPRIEVYLDLPKCNPEFIDLDLYKSMLKLDKRTTILKGIKDGKGI